MMHVLLQQHCLRSTIDIISYVWNNNRDNIDIDNVNRDSCNGFLCAVSDN